MPGYIGAGVEVMKVEMVESNPSGVVDHGRIEVIGSSVGKFKVCLQSIEERRYTQTFNVILINQMKISLLLKLTGMFYENRIFSYDLRQKFIYLNRATIADEICLTVNVEEGNVLT